MHVIRPVYFPTPDKVISEGVTHKHSQASVGSEKLFQILQNLGIRLLTQHHKTQTNWVVENMGTLSATAATSHEKPGRETRTAPQAK